MKCVKYFSKRPASHPSVKRFSARNGTVKRFSNDGEISLSSIDPDKFYLYKDSNVNIPGFAIDKGDYIIEASRHSRGYKLTKAYGPFDTPAEAESYADSNAVSLINSDTVVNTDEPVVATMSADDQSNEVRCKMDNLESKVDQLTSLVTELVAKMPVKSDSVDNESKEVTVTESLIDEPQNPEDDQNSADTGAVGNSSNLGEQIPANTTKIEQVYTQVPEEEIISQFSNLDNSDNVVMTSSDDRDSMFSCLF
jgi:hypothetical protein